MSQNRSIEFTGWLLLIALVVAGMGWQLCARAQAASLEIGVVPEGVPGESSLGAPSERSPGALAPEAPSSAENLATEVKVLAERLDPRDMVSLKAKFPDFEALSDEAASGRLSDSDRQRLEDMREEGKNLYKQRNEANLRQVLTERREVARGLLSFAIDKTPDSAFESREALSAALRSGLQSAARDEVSKSPAFELEIATGKLRINWSRDMGSLRVSVGEVNLYRLANKVLIITLPEICYKVSDCRNYIRDEIKSFLGNGDRRAQETRLDDLIKIAEGVHCGGEDLCSSNAARALWDYRYHRKGGAWDLHEVPGETYIFLNSRNLRMQIERPEGVKDLAIIDNAEMTECFLLQDCRDKIRDEMRDTLSGDRLWARVLVDDFFTIRESDIDDTAP